MYEHRTRSSDPLPIQPCASYGETLHSALDSTTFCERRPIRYICITLSRLPELVANVRGHGGQYLRPSVSTRFGVHESLRSSDVLTIFASSLISTLERLALETSPRCISARGKLLRQTNIGEVVAQEVKCLITANVLENDHHPAHRYPTRCDRTNRGCHVDVGDQKLSLRNHYANDFTHRATETELVVAISHIVFHEHPLFGKEDCLYSQLRFLYGEYRQRVESQHRRHLLFRIAIVVRLTHAKTRRANCRSNVGSDSRTQRICDVLLDALKCYIREQQAAAAVVAALYAAWNRLKALRQRQGFGATSAKVVALKHQRLGGLRAQRNVNLQPAIFTSVGRPTLNECNRTSPTSSENVSKSNFELLACRTYLERTKSTSDHIAALRSTIPDFGKYLHSCTATLKSDLALKLYSTSRVTDGSRQLPISEVLRRRRLEAERVGISIAVNGNRMVTSPPRYLKWPDFVVPIEHGTRVRLFDVSARLELRIWQWRLRSRFTLASSYICIPTVMQLNSIPTVLNPTMGWFRFSQAGIDSRLVRRTAIDVGLGGVGSASLKKTSSAGSYSLRRLLLPCLPVDARNPMRERVHAAHELPWAQQQIQITSASLPRPETLVERGDRESISYSNMLSAPMTARLMLQRTDGSCISRLSGTRTELRGCSPNKHVELTSSCERPSQFTARATGHLVAQLVHLQLDSKSNGAIPHEVCKRSCHPRGEDVAKEALNQVLADYSTLRSRVGTYDTNDPRTSFGNSAEQTLGSAGTFRASNMQCRMLFSSFHEPGDTPISLTARLLGFGAAADFGVRRLHRALTRSKAGVQSCTVDAMDRKRSLLTVRPNASDSAPPAFAAICRPILKGGTGDLLEQEGTTRDCKRAWTLLVCGRALAIDEWPESRHLGANSKHILLRRQRLVTGDVESTAFFAMNKQNTERYPASVRATFRSSRLGRDDASFPSCRQRPWCRQKCMQRDIKDMTYLLPRFECLLIVQIIRASVPEADDTHLSQLMIPSYNGSSNTVLFSPISQHTSPYETGETGTFVRMSFQGNHRRTSLEMGACPRWNETFELPCRIPVDILAPGPPAAASDCLRICMFTESRFTSRDFSRRLISNPRGDEPGKICRCEFIGDITIPLSTLFRIEGRIEGTLRVNAPIIQLGAHDSFAVARTVPQEVPVQSWTTPQMLARSVDQGGVGCVYSSHTALTENQKLKTGSLQLALAFRPKILAGAVVPADPVSSFEDVSLVKAGTSWLRDVRFQLESRRRKGNPPRQTPATRRSLRAFVLSSTGDAVLACRFLRPQQPPPGIDTPAKVAHFVSLIPFVITGLSLSQYSRCCVSQEFLDEGSGNWEEHATLLHNYLAWLQLHSSSQVHSIQSEMYLVCGSDLLQTPVVYVMQQSGLYQPNLSNVILWNPKTGDALSVTDERCSHLNIACLISKDNCYANIQMEAKLKGLSFTVTDRACWRPLFYARRSKHGSEMPRGFLRQKRRPGVFVSVQPQILRYNPPSVTEALNIQNEVTEQIKELVICWRSNLGPTSFAADFSLALQKLLPTLEHLQAGGAITGAAISQHKW
eukprot:CAMPEP_0118891262 /NCGR_PEP_ID=MMETSP1166-20130328/1355_1 /TAXON_ID=1104430 /ORGANISM="Chrysoreinhardia sp, Strain CCMP3193" /LENGTH=1557 /DNA_ID=CAMNT_0006829913 /DNA_START=238 /DNA_END=4908 /DNA_ORIENTATION=+